MLTESQKYTRYIIQKVSKLYYEWLGRLYNTEDYSSITYENKKEKIFEFLRYVMEKENLGDIFQLDLDNIEEAFEYIVTQGDFSIIVTEDLAEFNYNGIKQFGTTFIGGDMYLDLSGWTLEEREVSGAQEDLIEDAVAYEVDYPVFQYEPGSGLAAGNFEDEDVYEDGYPIHQYTTSRDNETYDETWTAVSTLQQLQDMNNDAYGKYYLTNDIDASDTVNWNGGDGFEPIGYIGNVFYGILDGNGFTISNLYMNTTSYRQGLFGTVGDNTITGSPCIIKNLNMTNASIKGSNRVGCLVGRADGVSIINCHVLSSSVEGTSYYIGGLVGELDGNATIEQNTISMCSFEGSVLSPSFGVGGIFGDAIYCQVEKTTCSGTVTGGYYVGGFAGQIAQFVSFTECSSSSSVEATVVNSGCGGFIGYFTSATKETRIFNDCYATGNVSGSSSVGGFIGDSSTTGAILTNCYSTGLVAGTGTDIGGFSGKDTDNDLSVTSCYWDTETSNQATSACSAVGKTTEEMKTESTFTGWDFTDVWEMERELISSISWIPISTVNELQLIGNDAAYPVNGYYYLADNIDCLSVENFEPIGFVSNPGDLADVATNAFQGTFDGDGYIISNITISKPSSSIIGLLGIVLNGTIRNIGVESITINALDSVGGLIGAIAGDCNVQRCYTTGEITTTFEEEWAITAGLIPISDDSVGGTRTITQCYSKCILNGYDLAGVVGWAGGNTTVDECYFAGELNYNNSEGYKNGISKSGDGISNSYWDIETTGIETSNSGIGKTTEEMKTESTYVDWDFIDTWEMGVGEAYYGSSIYIAHNNIRQLKIDTINKVLTANRFEQHINNSTSEGTYFVEDGVLYFQTKSETTDEYYTWLSIGDDVVYLLPVYQEE